MYAWGGLGVTYRQMAGQQEAKCICVQMRHALECWGMDIITNVIIDNSTQLWNTCLGMWSVTQWLQSCMQNSTMTQHGVRVPLDTNVGLSCAHMPNIALCVVDVWALSVLLNVWCWVGGWEYMCGQQFSFCLPLASPCSCVSVATFLCPCDKTFDLVLSPWCSIFHYNDVLTPVLVMWAQLAPLVCFTPFLSLCLGPLFLTTINRDDSVHHVSFYAFWWLRTAQQNK